MSINAQFQNAPLQNAPLQTTKARTIPTLVGPRTVTSVWSMSVGVTLEDAAIAVPSADEDAQALHEWLTEQADVSADRALLLTRRSPTFYQRSTVPDRSTLSYWIGQLRTHGIRTGDTLWFFWSGPGSGWAGEDYLLPLDANLSQPPVNWIKTRSLLNALKSLQTDRIVVCLDIQCRLQSPSAQPQTAQPWGEQTQRIAQQLGIPTVLLTQPEQNRSSARLGQGLLTAALLDTFRSHAEHQGFPEFLQRFSKHLPSLCDLCDRPMQLQIVAQTEAQTEAGPITIPRPRLSDCLTTGDLRRYARPPVMTAIATPPTAVHPPTHPQNPVPPELGVRGPLLPKPLLPKPSIEFRLVMLTGILSAFSLGLLSVWTTQSLQSHRQHLVLLRRPTPSPTPTVKISPKYPPDRTLAALPVPEEPAGDSNRILEEARNYITPTDPDELLRAIDRISQIPPGDPGYVRAQKQIDRWSENLFRLAQIQANLGNWRAAIAIAGQVRQDRTALYSTAQKSIREWTIRSR